MKNRFCKTASLVLGCFLSAGGAISALSASKANEAKAGTDITHYNLFVCDVEFTEENLVINSDDSSSVKGGSATFDPETNTLTLDGFDVEGTGYHDVSVNAYYYVIAYKGDDLLNLHLTNNNSIRSTAVPTNNQPAYALYTKGALSISGEEGTSAFTGPETAYRNYGIYATGNLTIGVEGAINATAKTATYEGAIGESAAIRSQSDITISSGTINATAGTSNGYSYGIFADTNSRTIKIEGGTVVATGGTSKYTNAGAMAKYFVMNNGDATMLAGDSENLSAGIFGVNGVVVYDGKLISAGKTYAIYGSYFNNGINARGWTNYEGTEGEASVAVGSSSNAITSFKRLKFPGKQSITPVVSFSNYVYGGTVPTPSVSGNSGEGEVTYFYNTTDSTTGGVEWKDITGTSLAAGTYYMYAVVAETEGYTGATSGTVSFTVAKADVTFTAPKAAQNLVYTGKDQTLVSGGEATNGTLMYKVNDGEYSASSPTGKNVGTYTVYYKVVGDDNYNDVAEESVQVTISANDKSALIAAINEANAYRESIASEYPEIAGALNTAIANAQTVNGNDNVTEQEINDAATALINALNAAKEAVSDNKKAEPVEDLIDAIGEVAFTTDCKDRIDEARSAYEALTDEQKALVGNYATLVAAEERYADLASKGKTKINDSENGVSIATTDGTTIPENIELKVEVRASVSAKEIENDYAKIKEVLEKNEEISKVYDVKLIRTVDGVETEIQPSDIKEGATIKVTMARPAEITTDDFRLLHIHNADDVEFVSDYSLENNELSFNINRLSEFAFVTKVAAKAVMPGWAIALIIVLATCCLAYFLLFFVFNKWIRDENDEDKAHRVLPFALGEKDGKKRLFSFPCRIFYREKEEIYKSKKDALDK